LADYELIETHANEAPLQNFSLPWKNVLDIV